MEPFILGCRDHFEPGKNARHYYSHGQNLTVSSWEHFTVEADIRMAENERNALVRWSIKKEKVKDRGSYLLSDLLTAKKSKS